MMNKNFRGWMEGWLGALGGASLFDDHAEIGGSFYSQRLSQNVNWPKKDKNTTLPLKTLREIDQAIAATRICMWY